MKGTTSMLNRIRKVMNERDQGFTLIELLVVIIIIGILAAIAIPVFLNQRKKGVDASLKSDLKNAATAAETYSTQYPTDTDFTTSTDDEIATFQKAGFKASPGNTLTVTGGPSSGYQLCAYNPGATTSRTFTAGLRYSSTAGGLTGTTVDCGAWNVIAMP